MPTATLKERVLAQAQVVRSQPLLQTLLDCLNLPAHKLGIVGGTIRDWAMGLTQGDLDLLWHGNFADLTLAVKQSGLVARIRPAYLTLSVQTHGQTIDIAATRQDTYALPGAQPQIAPANLDADLRRRDFTANAMAIFWNDNQPQLHDPLNGLQDISDGVLRPVAAHTLAEDPVRLLRGARYITRFAWGISHNWATQLDKATRYEHWQHIARGRLWREFQLIADEDTAINIYQLLNHWGIGQGVFGETLQDTTLACLAAWRAKGREKRKSGKNWLLDLATITHRQPTIREHILQHWQTSESELNRLNKLLNRLKRATVHDPYFAKLSLE